ncbi:hypothetical protein V8B97DRAFT_1093813 [Scleroderma yunnanense]
MFESLYEYTQYRLPEDTYHQDEFNKYHPLRRVTSITDPLILGIECNHNEEPSDVEQFAFDILNEYLQPFSSTSPTDAAWQFNDGLPLNHPDLDEKDQWHPGPLMEEIWDFMWRLAQQIPHDHPSQERFVQFIVALRDLPVDIPICIYKTPHHLWHDLPMLEFYMEWWFHTLASNDILTNENACRRWHSHNALTACLVHEGIGLKSVYLENFTNGRCKFLGRGLSAGTQ